MEQPAANASDKLEILSVSLLQDSQTISDQFSRLSRLTGVGLGWHYLLDLTWTVQQLDLRPGMLFLDAGGGFGLLQWWLAKRGFDVISVDRSTRASVPRGISKRYTIRSWPLRDEAISSNGDSRKLLRRLKSSIGRRKGVVYFYDHDLSSMSDVKAESIDAVVSISALEHNTPDGIHAAVGELMRVLKPGGRLVATLGAAKEEDWFHKPSAGWCYTEKTIRQIFDLTPGCPSNYGRYDELFRALRDCATLRENLAEMYFQSGKNGMPWGIWNPKYLPVGIVKIKK